MPFCLGVARETRADERRVALVPELVKKFTALGCRVVVERGAGDAADIPDDAFSEADLVDDRSVVLAECDMFLCVQPPSEDDIKKLSEGNSVLGFLSAHLNIPLVAMMRERGITAYSVELIPRISRAQSMDALSSQAAVAGYKAALISASTLGRFLPMLTTAAGTIRPAKALVIGAGVAGLQALATLRRLGAMVTGYDVRPETREQVESLGARFLDLSVSAAGEGGYARELTAEEKAQQQQALKEALAGFDVVVTTAAIPGRPAPRILTTDMVEMMPSGAVVVDIAAEGGGNCELTKAGETVHHGAISIVGPVNLPSQLPVHASEMYARNLYNFLSPFVEEGEYSPDFEDEIIAGSCVTHGGEIQHEGTRKLVEEAGQ